MDRTEKEARHSRVRIAHIADIHLGFSSHSRIYQQFKLGKDLVQVSVRELGVYLSFLKVLQEIKTHNPDVLVVAGDLFDSPRPSPLAIGVAILGFTQFGIPTFIISGNHDEPPSEGISPCTLLPFACKNVSVVATTSLETITFREHDFYLLPSSHTLPPDTTGDILVAHLPIDGPEEYKFTSSLFDSAVAENFTVCLFGDLHRHYTQKNILYPGALEKFSFGEAHNTSGYLLIDVEDGAYTWRFRPWDPMVRLLDLTISSQEELDSLDIKDCVVRITSTCELDLKRLRERNHRVIFRLRDSSRVDTTSTQITGNTLQEMWEDFLKSVGKEHLLRLSIELWKEAIRKKT